MRLYPLGATQAVIDHPQWGRFEPGEHGGFDLPDDLSDELHSFCQRGKRIWETELERSERLHGEETERRRDPQTLYGAVAELLGLAKKAGEAQAAETPATQPETPEPPKGRAKAAATPAE